MTGTPSQFSRDQIEALSERVASKVVEEMLVKLGIDHARPLEVQHDFQILREVRTLLTDREFQADLSYLRKWRQTMEGGTSKGVIAVATLIFSGIAALIILGLKAWLSKL